MPQISIIKKQIFNEARKFDDLDEIAFAFEKWGKENGLSFWK